MSTESEEKAKDTGLAAVLILLLVAHFWELPSLVVPAILVLLVTMIWPSLFSPLARVWFGMSHAIGTVASKVILTAIFLLIATPIGLLRRALGADSMRSRRWKEGQGSVFLRRDHVYTAGDLDRPY